MKSFKEYFSSDVVTEAPTGKLIKRVMANTISKRKYDAALKVLTDIWKRKGSEKNRRHGIEYYAGVVSKQYDVDARVLRTLAIKSGL